MKIILQDYLKELEKCSKVDLERKMTCEGLSIAFKSDESNKLSDFFHKSGDYSEGSFVGNPVFHNKRGVGSFVIYNTPGHSLIYNVVCEERDIDITAESVEEYNPFNSEEKDFLEMYRRADELANTFNRHIWFAPLNRDRMSLGYIPEKLVRSAIKDRIKMVIDIGNVCLSEGIPVIIPCYWKTDKKFKFAVYHPSLDK